ncbi:hypothetical protein [Alishewanella phage vB_AspM_Slicko01]|nr:hypothetical protein [Alishewanella phage vB_AspM_Slicko01]
MLNQLTIKRIIFNHWRQGTKLRDSLESNRLLTEKEVSETLKIVMAEFFYEGVSYE